ncbi:hypothetical protein QE393_003307 [Pseudomonas sp. SORGH_AS 211]|nr:hypothetical protein [Pseudomonas sp. SORGH_AS_0211]
MVQNQTSRQVGCGGDEDALAVEAGIVDAVLDMGEEGAAHREVRRGFQVQQAWQHPAVATGVEQEVGGQRIGVAVVAQHLDPGLFTAFAQGHGGHPLAVADCHALACGVVGEDLVEGAALDLEGAAPATVGVAEVEVGVALAPGEGGADLGLKNGGLDRRQHPGFLDEIQAVGEQALADGKARKMLGFQHQHRMAATLEQRGDHGAGRAGTDDDQGMMFNHDEGPFRGRRGARPRVPAGS